MPRTCLKPGDERWPTVLTERLGASLPSSLWALGNLDILAQTKTALFCSARCPGNVILSAYDQAAKWRDAGRCVISGFHSSVEKECLRIFLRGSQPIIICPARNLDNFRLPTEWKEPLSKNRLLLLSCFETRHRRATADLAIRRNELVAALADEAFIIHTTAGGHIEKLIERLEQLSIPVVRVVGGD